MKKKQMELPIVEYYPEYHMYIKNGIVLPSVTQVTSWIVRKDYSGVPAPVLNAKADYGNRIHKWVEQYALTGETLPQTELMRISTKQWEQIENEMFIRVQDVEQIISYEDKFAGTYDMYGTAEGIKTLIDIKTTAEYDEEYLAWQMGMYKMALEDERGEDVQRCYCAWMPKGKRMKMIDVKPKSKVEILEKVEEYQKSLVEDLPF